MTHHDENQKIWNIVKKIKVGMLTSTNGSSYHARPMRIVQDEYNGVLWFYTRIDSDKTKDIYTDDNVCVTFCDPNDSQVSLSGVARLSMDRALIDRFWSPFVAAWFPEGKDDPALGVLEITVNKGEIWEERDNKLFQMLEIIKANISGKQPDLSCHEKI